MPKKMNQKRVRFRAGPSIVRRAVITGRRASPFEDFYYWLLGRTWLQFLLFVSFVFVGINLVYMILYSLSPDCVDHAQSLEDLFYFSVETMATIGYGEMTPKNRFAYVLVCSEALLGIMTTALLTGMTFAKFAKSTSRILFSEKLTIHSRDGVPHLFVRLANFRNNNIHEAQLKFVMAGMHETQEGESLRRVIDIPLIRDNTPFFRLTWTAAHKIDETSPFYGDREKVLSRLFEQKAELFFYLKGYDETIGQTIHARAIYSPNQIVWNSRFHDVLQVLDDGTSRLDYAHFHQIVPISKEHHIF